MTQTDQPDSGAAAAARHDLLQFASTRSVPLKLITTPPNVRTHVNEAALSELAAGIDRDGLLHPIVVFRQQSRGERYTIACGYRRLKAHELLKRTEIEARVIPPEHYSEAAIRQLRAIENLDREDLTPIEEAISCLAVVEALDEEHQRSGKPSETLPDDDFHADVAARLGRPKRWVEGRLSLLRLSAKQRTALANGDLLLGHALEIAKLVDPKEQDDVAGMIWWSEDRTRCRTSVSEIRAAVEKRMTSLHGVPWKLDEPFAGKPACTACPHNTDNAPPALFQENDDAAPERARCLSAKCFKAKTTAAEREVNRAVKVLVKGQDAGAPAVRETAKQFVKPATVARKARAELAPPAKTATSKKTRSTATSRDQERWKAQDNLGRAESKRALDLTNAICDRIGEPKQNPLAYVALGLLVKTQAWATLDRHGYQRGKGNKTQKTARSIIDDAARKIGAAKRDDVATFGVIKLLACALVDEADPKRTAVPASAIYDEPWSHGGMDDGPAEVIATALGLEVPPRPKLEDFLPKQEPAKPATPKKKTSRAVRTKKKTTKRAATTQRKKAPRKKKTTPK